MAKLSIQKLNQAFSSALRHLREDTGLSQEALAAQSGLDRTYISLLERNQRQPTLKTIVLLANALDLSLSEFVVVIEEMADKD